MNNTTQDSVIPALQSIIARNRNELSHLNAEFQSASLHYKWLLDRTYKEDERILQNALNCVRWYKEQVDKIVPKQKVLKFLLAREYAEERIREFNKQCQLARNK